VSDPTPAAGFPRTVPAAIALVKGWFGRLSKPARVLLATTVAAGVLISGFLAFQKANEPYAPLFSQLDREDASAIVTKLKELKIPYKVDADGSTVEVPESRARELRLELAGSGLPKGVGVGFESFDKMRLGATDFEQRVLFRRALEGELTRTIMTLGSVESARVHLVLPEKSVFITRGEPASASIMLRLRPGHVLGPPEVGGVVHLVAAAVPGLDPEHIAVVTTDGVMLHKPRRSGTGNGQDTEDADDDARVAARSYESSLEDRVRSMLERVVGPGHADVRVTAEIDPARVERIEDRYDPSKSALRSEEESLEHGGSDVNESAAGVPGAESNLPTGSSKGATAKAGAPAASASGAASASAGAPATAPVPPVVAAVGPGAVRESHTRNYEIDHVSEKRTTGGGALKRLTVAVVLDGIKSDKGMIERPKDELDKLLTLVRSASGASDARGDVVTVESMVFAGNVDVVPEVEPPAPVVSEKMRLAQKWGPAAIGAVVVLVIAGFALRRSKKTAPEMTASTPGAILAGAVAPSLEAELRPALASGDLRAQAVSRATQDPATAALVLRFWLGTATPEVGAGARPTPGE
jgi:flagellar M-ring protein FliF